MEEKNKKLKLMRFWLFGVFVIAFAAITAFLYVPTKGNLLMAITGAWLIWLILAVACVLFYFIYKWILDRKK
jgi:amino acid transporter